MVLSGGEEGRVGYIAWYSELNNFEGQIYGGSVDGMVLHSRDSDGSWTELCIEKGQIRVCPPQDQ